MQSARANPVDVLTGNMCRMLMVVLLVCSIFFFVWFSLMTSYGVRRDMEREDACLHIMCAVTYLMEVDNIIRVSASISIRYQTWSSFPKYPIFSARAFDSLSIYLFFASFRDKVRVLVCVKVIKL